MLRFWCARACRPLYGWRQQARMLTENFGNNRSSAREARVVLVRCSVGEVTSSSLLSDVVEHKNFIEDRSQQLDECLMLGMG